MGSFKANPTKPYAMIDCTGDNIVITPAKRPARVNGTLSQMASTRASTANASPVVSQPTLATKTDVDFSDFSNRAAIDPMLAPGSKAMADILRPVGRTTQSQRSSHASSMSVFFPMDSLHDVNALYASDDEVDEDQDDEDNDGGNLLDFEDLIDYDVISSDDDDLAPDTSLPTPTSASVLDQSTHTQPKTPSPQTPSTDELMAHFDKGVIGAFRQGQNQHQHQSHPQAFRSGRQGLTNSLSPSSKRKMSGGFAPAGALEPFPKRRLVHHG